MVPKRPIISFLCTLAAGATLVACSSSGSGQGDDASADDASIDALATDSTMMDVALEGSTEAAPEASDDGPTESGIDAAPEAQADARPEAAADAGVESGADTGSEAAADAVAEAASMDITTDAAVDAITEAGPDAVPEAGCGSDGGNVDQSQLTSDGNLAISTSQSVGQTVTLGATGVLTGVEFGLGNCNGVDSAASIQLTVSRGTTALGVASVSASTLPTNQCGGDALSSTTGAGFFDLGGQCITVTSGDTLTLTLGVTSATGACSGGQCAGGAHAGQGCLSDPDCQYAARAWDSSGNPYASGTAFANGSPQTDSDLAFKLFVR